jgi:hypothetical protein
MNRIDPVRVIVFAGVLAICGTITYAVLHHRAKQKSDAAKVAAEIKAQKEQEHASAVAQQEKYFAYINTNITRNAGEEMIAVACMSENRTMNPAIADALAKHFNSAHIKFTSSFFRPTIITDRLFEPLYDGSKDIFQKMELENFLDGLLLARQEVQYSKNEALDGVITASMNVQIVTLPVTAQIESQSWSLSANGAGFNNADARMQAEERIIKQITESTTMSLNQFSTTH